MTKGKTINYDYLIEGDLEAPKIPRISIKRGGAEQDYEYIVKETYLGVLPQKLKNIFLLGFIRPVSGGLANITEMQCLLTHKAISEPIYRNHLYENLDKKINEYNAEYSFSDEVGPVDHLVNYGIYVGDVAKEIGIFPRLRDFRSLSDVMKHIFAPNCAFKYRQKGRYKVDRCQELSDYIWEKHDKFNPVRLLVLRFFLYYIIVTTAFIMLYMNSSIGLVSLVLLLFLQYLLKPLFIIPTSLISTNTTVDKIRSLYLLAGIALVIFIGPIVVIPVLALDFIGLYLTRKLKPAWARYIFRDLKTKAPYRDFYNKYVAAFRKVKSKVKQG